METVKIEFSGEALDMILKYQEVSEATTIQNAIMNAVSLALDHADDCVIYKDCADAMLKMWMDNVLTDGEYDKIIDKLNKAHIEGRL